MSDAPSATVDSGPSLAAVVTSTVGRTDAIVRPSIAPVIAGAPDLVVAPKRPWYSRQMGFALLLVTLPWVPQIAAALGATGKWLTIFNGITVAVLRVLTTRPLSLR